MRLFFKEFMELPFRKKLAVSILILIVISIFVGIAFIMWLLFGSPQGRFILLIILVGTLIIWSLNEIFTF